MDLAVTTPFAAPLHPHGLIHVHDDVLPDREAYRRVALEQDYGDLIVGPAVFHGIAPCRSPLLIDWLAAHYPQLTVTTTAFRRSPFCQVEPSFVHNDCDLGETSGILYLNPDPPEGDGTDFYREWDTRQVQRSAQETAEMLKEWLLWRDTAHWEPWHHVEAAFGRLVLFPSAYFHARAIPENYGSIEDESARLIQVVFCRGSLCVSQRR